MRYWNLAGWTATCEVLECIAMVDRQLADNLFALQVVPTALQTSAIKAENVTNIGKTLALTTNKNIIMITSNIFSVAIPDPTRSGIFCPRCPGLFARIRILATNPYCDYKSNPTPLFRKCSRSEIKSFGSDYIFLLTQSRILTKKLQQTFYEIYKKSYVCCF